MKLNGYYIIIVALLILPMLQSCRNELCYDHYPTLDLSFKWELEWERDYGMNHHDNWNPDEHHYYYDELRPSVPEWVKMVRYFDDGRINERFFTPEGEQFEVAQGENCSILFYNGDTEYIVLSDVASLRDVCATATTRTRSGSSLKDMQELHQTSRTTNPPDVIYASFVENMPGIMNHEVKHLPVTMQPLVYTYLITYEFECGIEYVALARGALGGMAEGVYLRTGVTTEQSSIILFDCDIHSDRCRSQVRSFGIPGFPDSYYGRALMSDAGPFTLNLEVRLTNGKTEDFYFDVTDQVKNQPRGGTIKVSGIRIENVVNPPASSGFDVDVSDWDDDAEQIDLPIEPFTNS